MRIIHLPTVCLLSEDSRTSAYYSPPIGMFAFRELYVYTPSPIGPVCFQRTREEWRTVFLICAGIAFFGAVVFGLLADGEQQCWASPPPVETVIAVSTDDPATQGKTTHLQGEPSEEEEEKITLDVLAPESNENGDVEADRGGGGGVQLDNDDEKKSGV